MSDIPFDVWTRVPNEELEKKGRAQWVYRPSGGDACLAQDAVISKECIDAPGACIWLSKEEAKVIFPSNKTIP